MRLTPVPLEQHRFAPFGDVISVDTANEIRTINRGHTQRFHNLAQLNLAADGHQPCISVFRSTPLPLPLRLTMMERHPNSTQAFVPLSNHPYLVVVAPSGDFDPTAIQAFIATAEQGVNYHAGTWHHFSLALQATSDFLVVDNDPGESNSDEIQLLEPVDIEL